MNEKELKEYLREYLKELINLIKNFKDITMPSMFDIYYSVMYLERFCHLNGLGKEANLIYEKYRLEVNEWLKE